MLASLIVLVAAIGIFGTSIFLLFQWLNGPEIAGKRAMILYVDTATLRPFFATGTLALEGTPQPIVLQALRQLGRIAFERDGQVLVIGSDGSGEQVITSGHSPRWVSSHELSFWKTDDCAEACGIYRIDLLTHVERLQYESDIDTGAVALWSNSGGQATRHESELNVFRSSEFGPGLYDTQRRIRALALSPDGGSIVFSVSGPIEETGIYFWRPTFLNSRPGPKLLGLGDIPALAWSPGGARVAFASNVDGDLEIYTMNVSDAGVARLTDNTGFDDTSPSWSPDGCYIAFASNRLGNWDIFVVRADGGPDTIIISSDLDEKAPDWEWFPVGKQPWMTPAPDHRVKTPAAVADSPYCY